ncbi:zinc finger BED domain-containing protein 1-like, partial [Aphis craccivora]
VQRGLKDINNIKKKVKSIVEYFKRSLRVQSKLQAMQQQMGLSPLKLNQDVVTR